VGRDSVRPPRCDTADLSLGEGLCLLLGLGWVAAVMAIVVAGHFALFTLEVSAVAVAHSSLDSWGKPETQFPWVNCLTSGVNASSGTAAADAVNPLINVSSGSASHIEDSGAPSVSYR
jgi:hypothetical protein